MRRSIIFRHIKITNPFLFKKYRSSTIISPTKSKQHHRLSAETAAPSYFTNTLQATTAYLPPRGANTASPGRATPRENYRRPLTIHIRSRAPRINPRRTGGRRVAPVIYLITAPDAAFIHPTIAESSGLRGAARERTQRSNTAAITYPNTASLKSALNPPRSRAIGTPAAFNEPPQLCRIHLGARPVSISVGWANRQRAAQSGPSRFCAGL